MLRTPSVPTRTGRGTRLAVATATAAAVLVAGAPLAGSAEPAPQGISWKRGALDPGLPVVGRELQQVVVTGVTGGYDALRRAVAQVGGTTGPALPLVDGLGARVPADRLPELAGLPGVQAVTADRSAPVSTIEWDESTTTSSYVATAGARELWGVGARGQGVGVAVLDTGISPHEDLAGRVVHGPDLSGEGDHLRDSYGHGTVMAGAIAGTGVATAPANRTGVAPRSHLVSIKVAGANGVTDVSTVLAGMHWAASFKDTYGIRVLNLSWGVPSTQDPAVDPLSLAVQRLWRLGITVVVAAGNSGPGAGTVTKPGDDPVVLTVGAYDDRGDLKPDNDVVPKWSSQGPTAQGLAKPDLVAPGRTLVLARAAGSTVERDNPKALVAPSYVKGSGSSQAAAVVSGAAALLLSARPELTPDQVKAALVRSAWPIPNVAATAQGAGRLRTAGALGAAAVPVVRQVLSATGTGTLEGSRGAMERVQVSCGGVTKVLNDETTAWCEPWSGVAWKDSDWHGVAWKSAAWTGVAWKADAWSGVAWKDALFAGVAWKGDTWSGVAWKSAAWSGVAWKEGAWTSAEYGDEDLFLTGFWGDRPKRGKRLTGEVSEGAEPGVDEDRPGRGCRSCST